MITTMMGVIILIIILVLLIILVLKMTKKYTHNMILMSRYIRDSYMVEKGSTNLGRGPPPFRAKKNIFLQESIPN